MFDNNLNKNLENIIINLSEIIEASKNKNLKNLRDGNINFYYNYDIIETNITANNKNYIINCDKIDNKYNYTEIKLSGNENGNLIVINNQNYSCDISRIEKGNGHAILSGSGNGDVWRKDMGHGHAIRMNSGEGNACNENIKHGHAIRTGSGEGNAIRNKKGKGHAIRIGNGKGSAKRDHKGNGYAIGSNNIENKRIIKI